MSAYCLPSAPPENAVATEWLFRGDYLSLHSWHCRRHNRTPAGEDCQSHSEIAVVLRGAFRYRGPRGQATADPNTALLIASNEGYESTHPLGCGDAGLSLVLEARCLDELAERGVTLSTLALELSSRAHYLLALLDRRLRDRREALTIEETMSWALDALLPVGAPDANRLRRNPEPDDAARIEAARELLASSLARPLRLDEVAAHVALSRQRLCRLFKSHTGVPVHRYLTRLRLRAALDMILDSTNDLTTVALDVGFSSHSHFTEAFRREFGCTPSATRRGHTAGLC